MLTPRCIHVLALPAEGHGNKTSAWKQGISELTAKWLNWAFAGADSDLARKGTERARAGSNASVPKLHAIGFALLLVGGFHAHGQSPASPKIQVGSVLDCNRLVHYVRPVYPKEAKRQHIGGTVKFRAALGVKGELRKIDVLEGHPMLVPAALRAVKKWRYTPCLLNGDAVEVIAEIEVPFTLTQ